MTAKRASGPPIAPKRKATAAKARPAGKVRPAAKALAVKKAAATKPAARKKAAKKSTTKTAPRALASAGLRDVVLAALADMKAVNVKALDVRALTDITDTMVVASGTSDRHVKSIADRVLQRCKEAGFRPYGMEGERDGEWVLVDLHDLVLHVMLPRVREFYALEKLWDVKGAAA
jgi:ribosome-associated protein